jgi:UrcA family protein
MTKIFIASLLAFTASPTLAEPPVTLTSFVQTADLDLASKSGQRILDKRLSQAIVEVCGEASPADLAGQNKVRACRKDAHNRFDAERDERIAAASSSPIQVAAR